MTEAQYKLARQAQDDPVSLTPDEVRELALIVLEQQGYTLPTVEPEAVN